MVATAASRTLAVVVPLLLMGLSGCLAEPESRPQGNAPPTRLVTPPSSPLLPASPAEARVVVAVIDTGINVYHDWFQRGASLSDEVLAEFVDAESGVRAERVPLARDGTYWERLGQDNTTWNALEPRKLYYFEGTNVLGISFDTKTPTRRPVIDEGSHGSGTAGAVVKANPRALIVMVESFGAAAEAWVAKQPWIDISSMSYGPAGSIPTGAVTATGTHVHTRAAWATGKIPVGAADNSPALAPNDETAGPPWVVGIAGDAPASGCRVHGSGTFPDFTSDFTQVLPMHREINRTRSMSGTSFATPKTAGAFSAALLQVREAWNHTGGIKSGAMALGPDGKRLTNGDLWSAFNRTATYFATNTCSGGSQPVNPAAPWLQMGYGHIEYNTANATADHILGVKTAAEKPVGAKAFQDAWMTYRHRLWTAR